MEQNQVVHRHKTAIPRKAYSKPLRLALLSGIVNSETTVLDYGCGRGSDVKFLKEDGITACQYDSYYFPENYPFLVQETSQFDIILLIYVLNTIECPQERLELLKLCFNQSKKGLIVSVRLMRERPKSYREYSDGILTRKGTFQKFYTQGEFQSYLFNNLNVNPEFLAPGIAFILKS